MAHGIGGPRSVLVHVARGAGIRDFVFVGHGRGDEAERMGMHKCAGNALRFDRRHVTGHALASGASIFMMCVLFKCGRVRTIRGRGPVTIQANLIRRLS